MKAIPLTKSPVVFKEDTHQYFLGSKELKGITSTLIRRAFPDKYKDIDPDVLANAARKGKELHEEIEFFDNFGPFDNYETNERIRNYQRVKDAYGLTTVANEYLVSDEQRYASSIDIVMLDSFGDICLVDTKTTWTLDKQSAGLQLSIYKRLFERQNPWLEVASIYVLWMPNKDHSIAELYELSVVADETIDALIKADIEDKPFQYESIPEGWVDIERNYRYWLNERDNAETHLAALKEQMVASMQALNLQSVKTDNYTVSYIPAKKTTRFDAMLFRKSEPETYKNYLKEVEAAAQIRVMPKRQKEEKDK